MENKKLTLGSLFDGSGGFPLAGLLCGITPVWASEIEPFPIRVTTKRLPFMKHYGDISQMDGGKIEPVDIITFGSPCTDLSIAGRREGLGGEHSVLFYEAVRIIKEMRHATNGNYPRYVCWENVPGAFSSNQGSDFKAVLDALIGIVEPEAEVPLPEKGRWSYADLYMGDTWSIAYRTLDAQYWGVPQRRRRIFLVADFRGRRAGKILFESEGVSGYSAESFRSWQRAAGSPAACSGAPSICLNDQGGAYISTSHDFTGTLRAEEHGHAPCVMTPAFALENHAIDGRIKIEKDSTVQTLTSRMGTGGMNVPLVLKIRSGCEGGGKGALIQEDKSATLATSNDQTLFVPQAYGISADKSNAMLSDNPHSGIYKASTARTLDANGGNPGCNQGGIAVVESYAIQGSMIGREDKNGPQGDGINEDVSFTLNTVDRHGVAYGIDRAAFNQGKNAQYNIAIEEELEPTLVAKGSGAVGHPTPFSSVEDRLPTTLASADNADPCVDNIMHTASGKDVVGTISASMGSKQWLGNQEAFSGDYHIMKPDYTVRRLTPNECARLQGFPDWWCAALETPEPTDDEISFWVDVWETHRRLTNSSKKSKTEQQIIKWLNQPHSDAAEYKMWGNGVALPCVYFVLSGIVCYDQLEG